MFAGEKVFKTSSASITADHLQHTEDEVLSASDGTVQRNMKRESKNIGEVSWELGEERRMVGEKAGWGGGWGRIFCTLVGYQYKQDLIVS